MSPVTPPMFASWDLQLSLAAFAQSTWSQLTPLILSLWSWQCCCWHRAYHSDLALLLVPLVKMESPHLLSFLQSLLCFQGLWPLLLFLWGSGDLSFLFLYSAGKEWPGCLEALCGCWSSSFSWVVIPGLDSSQPPNPCPVCTDAGKTGDPLPPSMKDQESFHWALRATISDSHEFSFSFC